MFQSLKLISNIYSESAFLNNVMKLKEKKLLNVWKVRIKNEEGSKDVIFYKKRNSFVLFASNDYEISSSRKRKYIIHIYFH